MTRTVGYLRKKKKNENIREVWLKVMTPSCFRRDANSGCPGWQLCDRRTPSSFQLKQRLYFAGELTPSASSYATEGRDKTSFWGALIVRAGAGYPRGDSGKVKPLQKKKEKKKSDKKRGKTKGNPLRHYVENGSLSDMCFPSDVLSAGSDTRTAPRCSLYLHLNTSSQKTNQTTTVS